MNQDTVSDIAPTGIAPAPPVDMRELSPYETAPRLREARMDGHWVVLGWQDGQQAEFPPVWLRDHCACPTCRHAQTFERLVFPIEGIDIAPEVQVADSHLVVNWADGHASRFDGGWLHQRRPGEPDRNVIPEAFRLLSETSIDFRFQDETQDIGVRAPIIECDDDGKVVEIRFNNW